MLVIRSLSSGLYEAEYACVLHSSVHRLLFGTAYEQACVTTEATFAAGNRKGCPFDEAVYSRRHHWDVFRSEM